MSFSCDNGGFTAPTWVCASCTQTYDDPGMCCGQELLTMDEYKQLCRDIRADEDYDAQEEF